MSRTFSSSWRPQLETLDNRSLPSAGIMLAAGVVTIEGTDRADSAMVTNDDRGTILNPYDDRLIVSLSQNGHVSHAASYDLWRNTLRPFQPTLHENLVTQIVFNGNEGDDFFRNDTALASDADGSWGDDHLIGGSGDDILHGFHGDDYLEGRGGNDFLIGAADVGDPHADGSDTLLGGAGDDILYCEPGGSLYDPSPAASEDGADWLFGGDGNDSLFGGHGDDVLSGDAGNDHLYGGTGNDDLYGGDGNDVLDAGLDDNYDRLYGGDGRDTYFVDSTFSHRRDFICDYEPGESIEYLI